MKISDIDPAAISVKGGIVPGTPAAEMINDPDKNIVLRVLDANTNKVQFTQKDAEGNELVQTFSLTGVTLEPASNEEPAG